MTFLVSLGIRYVYNRLSIYRIKKLSDNLWNEDVSPVEIKIELFGLGRYIGKKENKSYATLPLDIISIISDKYQIKKEELVVAFTKGMLDSIEESYKETEPKFLMITNNKKSKQNKINKLLEIIIELFCGSSLFFINCIILFVVLLLLIIIPFKQR